MALLERENILDDLRRLEHQAREGRGSLVLIGGEAGAGKSAVLRYFVDEVRGSAAVLSGQCDALSTPRALGPLFDMASAEPTLQRLLVEGVPRDRLFRAVLTRLAGGHRGTVLAIEDAHWGDEATLDLVRYLGRRIAATRSLAIVTYRDDELGPRHPLRGVLGDLASAEAVHRVRVPPLSPQGVAALATGSEIDAAELHARTRGNPFFVAAVLAAGGEIPATVRDAVLARASRLPATTWTVLAAAAVIGALVDPDLLAWVANPAAEDLDACLESGILEVHERGFAFRHELARQAILSAISPISRSALHAQVLKRLERAPREDHDPARLADHAEEAGDHAAVLRYAPAAARRAARLHAHREAADQFARALRYVARLPASDRARLFEAHAHECALTAQIEPAVASRHAAIEIWRDRGDRRNEAENRCHLALLHWHGARMAQAEQEATAAVATLEDLPPGRELALAFATLARLRGTTLDDDEAISLGVRAIALAETFGATATLADALITVGVARLSAGDERGREQLERSIRLASDAGLDDLAARAYANLGFGYDEQFRFALAAHYYSAGIDFCAERDLDHFRLHMTAWLARCRVYLGDWDRAAALVASVLAAQNLAPVTRFVGLLVASLLRVRRGQPGAEPMLDEALAIAAESGSLYRLGSIRAARAEAAWLRGDPATAAVEADAVYELAVQRRHRWFTGELAYWRWKGGAHPPSPAPMAEPYERLITGDWTGAALAWDALGCPYDAAWARAQGNDEAALRSALATFEGLGAQPAAALVRGRLRELGVRGVPRGPRPATRSSPAGLTSREAEVLELLAAGHGNREIARRLFLSPRTIEKHVSSVLAKLGAASRADAVAAAERLGIVPQSE